MIDSAFRTGTNYYSQVFVEECKYAVKEKKMLEDITDDIEISSDDYDREDSDEEISSEEILMKKNLMKKINVSKKTNKNIFWNFFFLSINMKNNYYQKHKEKLRKEAREIYQIKRKDKKGAKRKKRLEADIKIFLKNKKKKSVSIIRNVSRSYLSIEEIII